MMEGEPDRVLDFAANECAGEILWASIAPPSA